MPMYSSSERDLEQAVLDLLEDGVIEPVGVGDDGYIIFCLTEYGRLVSTYEMTP